MNAMKVKPFAVALTLTAVVLPHLVLADSQTATYRVTFNATWSSKTHPHAGFPAQPMFSPLVGGVHSDRAVYWKAGELASPGIKLMAEEGIPDGLATEVRADISRGRALGVLSSPVTTDSPGSNTIASFKATKDFPLVTLVTMFGSTPDWFTGVSGLSLLDDQDWVEERSSRSIRSTPAHGRISRSRFASPLSHSVARSIRSPERSGSPRSPSAVSHSRASTRRGGRRSTAIRTAL